MRRLRLFAFWRCGFVVAVALGTSTLLGLHAQPGPSVRFHHFHFRVADPARSMNQAATTLNGTRVLLRGLGVGARIGTEYALFDRFDSTDTTADRRRSVEGAFSEARAWLAEHGVAVEPSPTGARAALARLFDGEVLDHVAFTTADTPAVVSSLLAHGANPWRQTEDSRLFRTASVGVEIVRDVDAPDAFWCPMHPDIRSAVAGKCPLCRMELVPIPPPRVGEYRMDVAVTAAAGGRGASKLRLTIRDPVSGRPVSSFATIHERLLHLFIIDRQLEYFRHVHPQQISEGIFELREPIPAGQFMVIADFLPLSGRPQMLQRAIVTPGYRAALFSVVPHLTVDVSSEKVESGVQVKLDATMLKAGKEATLKFTLTDASTNTPITDLEPFLGAPGHVLLVNADLTDSNHVHPEEPATHGPVITFHPMMPAAGLYKLWLQFQRGGLVVTVPFVVSVAAP
jgi:heavy metal-binding protein